MARALADGEVEAPCFATLAGTSRPAALRSTSRGPPRAAPDGRDAAATAQSAPASTGMVPFRLDTR